MPGPSTASGGSTPAVPGVAPDSQLTEIAVAFARSTVVVGSNVLDAEAYRALPAIDVFALVAVLPVVRREGRAVGPAGGGAAAHG